MFDQLKMMRQAHALQKKMKDIVIATEYEGVKVEVNGKFDILNLSISEELLTDRGRLEQTIKQAINNAQAQAQKQTAESMRAEMGGLLGM